MIVYVVQQITEEQKPVLVGVYANKDICKDKLTENLEEFYEGYYVDDEDDDYLNVNNKEEWVNTIINRLFNYNEAEDPNDSSHTWIMQIAEVEE